MAFYRFVGIAWLKPASPPATAERTVFFTQNGDRFVVPEGSPLRDKLVIETVRLKEIERRLVLPAVVEADPARTVKVLPPVAGHVVTLEARLGERVSAQQELAVLFSGDLAQAFSDQEKARAALTLAKQTLDRLMSLERISAISIKERQQAQSDYLQAQSELERSTQRLTAIGISADQKTDTQHLSLKSPVAGSIIDLQVAPGTFVNDPTAPMMTIANLDTIWVTANVPEKDAGLVTKGQAADVTLTAYPGEVFKGTVLFLSDVLDTDTRRIKVRIAFPNPGTRLKPNMFAAATFLAPKRQVPVVATNALVLRNESDHVFVEVAPWTFEARPVDVDFQQGSEAIVSHGLAQGDRVVVKGGVLLND